MIATSPPLARTIARVALALALSLGGGIAFAADPSHQMHGSSDAFATTGVAVAWGVLRGADEASTTIVVRIVTDPQAYPWLAVTGVDPFTKAERVTQPPAASPGTLDVRIARAQFADFPRTELRLYTSAASAQRSEPTLIVYYHGVPDTTPEFKDAAGLDAHLAARVAALRAPGGKAP